MNLRSVLFVLPIIILITGCKKFDEDLYHGVIKNNTADNIHVDFYASSADYCNSTNALRSLTIAPYETLEIPHEFEGGKKLYVDWYSDDYLNTGWGRDSTFVVVNITREMDPAWIINDNKMPARSTWLSNGRYSSTWRAYDARVSAADPSLWNQLAVYDKDRQITFRKNFTGVYTGRDNQGVLHTDNFTFRPEVISTSMGISVRLYIYFGMFGVGVIGPVNPTGSICKDTASSSAFRLPTQQPYLIAYYKVP